MYTVCMVISLPKQTYIHRIYVCMYGLVLYTSVNIYTILVSVIY